MKVSIERVSSCEEKGKCLSHVENFWFTLDARRLLVALIVSYGHHHAFMIEHKAETLLRIGLKVVILLDIVRDLGLLVSIEIVGERRMRLAQGLVLEVVQRAVVSTIRVEILGLGEERTAVGQFVEIVVIVLEVLILLLLDSIAQSVGETGDVIAWRFHVELSVASRVQIVERFSGPKVIRSFQVLDFFRKVLRIRCLVLRLAQVPRLIEHGQTRQSVDIFGKLGAARGFSCVNHFSL